MSGIVERMFTLAERYVDALERMTDAQEAVARVAQLNLEIAELRRKDEMRAPSVAVVTDAIGQLRETLDALRGRLSPSESTPQGDMP